MVNFSVKLSFEDSADRILNERHQHTSTSEHASAISGATPPSRPIAMLEKGKFYRWIRHLGIQTSMTEVTKLKRKIKLLAKSSMYIAIF